MTKKKSPKPSIVRTRLPGGCADLYTRADDPLLTAARTAVQPLTDKANAKRAKSARKAMNAGGYTDEPETDVTDILVDLRHYCRAKRLDFANLSRIALDHYDAEVTPDDIEVTSREAGF